MISYYINNFYYDLFRFSICASLSLFRWSSKISNLCFSLLILGGLAKLELLLVGPGKIIIIFSPPVPMSTPSRVNQSVRVLPVQFSSVSDNLELCVTIYCCSVSLCNCESAPPTLSRNFSTPLYIRWELGLLGTRLAGSKMAVT